VFIRFEVGFGLQWSQLYTGFDLLMSVFWFIKMELYKYHLQIWFLH